MKRKQPSAQEPESQDKRLKQSEPQLNQTDNEEVQQKVNDQFLDIFDFEIRRIEKEIKTLTALNQNTLFAHANFIAELDLYLFVLKNSLDQIIEAANIPEGDHYASKLSEILYIVHGAGNNATTLDEESKNEFLGNIALIKQQIDVLLNPDGNSDLLNSFYSQ